MLAWILCEGMITVYKDIYRNVTMGFGTLLGAFFLESVRHMVIWLIVMFAVVACDLVAKIACLAKTGGKIRLSKGARDTMCKMCTYFSAVMTASIICVALGKEDTMERWVVIFICGIEGLSIAGNLLKMKGYRFDTSAALRLVMGKLFKIDKDDAKEIIKNGEKDHEDE